MTNNVKSHLKDMKFRKSGDLDLILITNILKNSK